MEKKLVSLLLALVMCMSLSVPAFAASPESEDAGIPNGLVLLDSEIAYADDGQGHQVEVTIEEYGRPGTFASENGIMPLADVGDQKTYVFKISNTALGFPSLAVGTPLTSAMKKAIAKVVAEKLGEKVAGVFIPGVNIASWVLAAIATGNALAGNNGFKVTVGLEYSSWYSNKEGVYCYGWEITNCDFDVY